MNHHLYFKSGEGKVEACIVGSGAFGRSLLATRTPRIHIRIAVDVSAETAAEALEASGWQPSDIHRAKGSAADTAAAFAAGKAIAADGLEAVLHLPFDILVEATGHPEAGARHAELAIEAGRHVVLVTKEADSVVGPGLARLARQRGVIVTPVDGDQPSLLIGLATWAEVLGMEIVAAGKSSEYDFVFDPETETLSSNGVEVPAPGFGALLEMGDRPVAELIAARAEAAAALPQRAVPDLCEMGVVSHSVDLTPDRPDFHCPLARIQEVPTIFSTREDGGLLQGERRLDVFNCLRVKGEISFAGGVFVVVRVRDTISWKILEEKGHILSRNGSTAMLYLPRHLLGLEAATSILEAVLLKRSSGAESPQPRLDLVAIAQRPLAAGTRLNAVGHHHSIDGISGALHPAAALGSDQPAPYYLVANNRLKRAVAAGAPVCLADLEMPDDSALLRLRRTQDAAFFAEAKDLVTA